MWTGILCQHKHSPLAHGRYENKNKLFCRKSAVTYTKYVPQINQADIKSAFSSKCILNYAVVKPCSLGIPLTKELKTLHV